MRKQKSAAPFVKARAGIRVMPTRGKVKLDIRIKIYLSRLTGKVSYLYIIYLSKPVFRDKYRLLRPYSFIHGNYLMIPKPHVRFVNVELFAEKVSVRRIILAVFLYIHQIIAADKHPLFGVYLRRDRAAAEMFERAKDRIAPQIVDERSSRKHFRYDVFVVLFIKISKSHFCLLFHFINSFTV